MSGQFMVSQHDLYNERICFVIPCYNEEGMVGRFYRALRDEIEKIDDLQHHILFSIRNHARGRWVATRDTRRGKCRSAARSPGPPNTIRHTSGSSQQRAGSPPP